MIYRSHIQIIFQKFLKIKNILTEIYKKLYNL